ncbi:MAG: GNAT family N-acetyltransferase [Oscillospiraceae bacterium]|jgi:GNAT superfamily N-acetyltransferase|nr:GNAT family N-acetyltransferase [Oscillospiraceae bacterium]
MEIRISQNADLPALTRLWSACFDDAPATIRLFMERRFPHSFAPAFFEGDRAVSAVYLLPAHLSIGGLLAPARYIYAAATLREARGAGLMGRLLAFAQSWARETGIDYLFLAPATAELAAYYGRKGFSGGFWSSAEKFESDFLTAAPAKIHPAGAEELHKIAAGYIRNFSPVWALRDYEYLVSDAECGGGVWRLDFSRYSGTAAVLPKDGGGATVDELFCREEDVPAALSAIYKVFPAAYYTVRRPAAKNKNVVCDGMIKAINGRSLPGKNDRPFLTLALR